MAFGTTVAEWAALRPDVQCERAASESGGAPTWIVHDPFAGRYLRIGWLEYEILSRWHLGDTDAIVGAIRNETTLDADAEDVGLMAQFLDTSGLLRHSPGGSSGPEARPTFMQRFGTWRFALLRPNALLDATLGIPRGVLSLAGRFVLLAMLMFCIVRITAEWSWFVTSVGALFDPAMIGRMLVALVFAKLIHEFGHAWACRHFGLDVPTMGVSVFFLWPFLYTDTTAAWRLKRRRDRALIAGAGVLAELVLGVVALTLWCVWPDGDMRQTLLFLGSFSIVMSLFVNANPLLKWDGYYVMSDLLGIENLQERAGRLGLWSVRRYLLGVGDPTPEPVSTPMRRLLVGYAWSSWLWRVVLFSGLAVVLYAFFFKLAGIALMLWVTGRYLVQPVVREFRQLASERRKFRFGPPQKAFAAAMALLLLLLALPLDRSVSVPGVLRPAVRADVYAPAPARLADAVPVTGATVSAGEVLFTLTSPSIESELRIAKLEMARTESLLDRSGGVRDVDNRAVVARQLDRERSTVAHLEERRDRLIVRSPVAGEVVWVDRNLRTGQWVSDRTPLVRIADPLRVAAVAYVQNAERRRLEAGRDAVFVPDDYGQPRFDLSVAHIDAAPVEIVDELALQAEHGGNVNPQANGTNWFAVGMDQADSAATPRLDRELTGTVHLGARADWFWAPLVRRVRHQLVRETTFQ